jgi:AraC family transcriptional regulator of adaptative response / DNA-3-methyladenine glycosylase II
MQVVQRARRLFDLGADALHIGSYLARNVALAGMVKQRPGLRVPGAWDGFELAVLAVLGQNLQTSNPPQPIGLLVKTFGRPVQVPAPGLTHLFPRPETLSEANLESIGIPAQQALTINALARAVLAGTLTFDSVKGARDAASRVQSLPGMEEDAAAYIAMRALGDPDAFPRASLAFCKALASHRSPVSAQEVARIFEGYRPWRAYAAMHYCAPMQQAGQQMRPAGASRKSSAKSIRPRSMAFRRPRFRS